MTQGKLKEVRGRNERIVRNEESNEKERNPRQKAHGNQ
jgi:hypothetical protein